MDPTYRTSTAAGFSDRWNRPPVARDSLISEGAFHARRPVISDVYLNDSDADQNPLKTVLVTAACVAEVHPG